MKSQHLVLVISDLGSGGAQRVLLTMAERWLDSGKKVSLITLDSEINDFFNTPKNLNRIVIGGVGNSSGVFSGFKANIIRVLKLRQALAKTRASIVLGFLHQTNILVVLASLGLDMKVIISERNDPSRQLFSWPWGILRKLLYPLADQITANSAGVLSYLSTFVRNEKLALLPNPIKENLPSANLPLPNPMILAVGRLHYQKAYDVLLDAFAKFSLSFPKWQLVIVGAGVLSNELKKQAKLLEIDQKIIWTGEVENPFNYYTVADIFAIPSRFEGVPNAMLEAMSCAIPVIVSNSSPGPLEYVEDRVTGLVVPGEDSTALSRAFALLAEDRSLRNLLGENAKRRVMENRLDKAVETWDKVIDW